jgi:hypothetical protein
VYNGGGKIKRPLVSQSPVAVEAAVAAQRTHVQNTTGWCVCKTAGKQAHDLWFLLLLPPRFLSPKRPITSQLHAQNTTGWCVRKTSGKQAQMMCM